MAFQYVRNLSVRWRLLGFIFFLLLFIVLSGTGGLLGMRVTKNSLSKVYNDNVKPMEELRQINEFLKFDVVTTIERILYEQIIWDDAIGEVSAAYTEIDRRINELVAEMVREDLKEAERDELVKKHGFSTFNYHE